ncbi:hypothetical protein [Candidatus Sororendozoicomonas aggregata]|uniref:hypothetical protein n=1 Tax=Candidatus Sororendozoicomonas aggregata TaxID=3073239 RepID=UPI002ED1C51E
MFSFLTSCISDQSALSASTEQPTLNGVCSSSFKNNLVQLINQRIREETKPKGSGLSEQMKKDIYRMGYYVGERQASVSGSLEQSIERWNKLINDDPSNYRWVEENIEEISTFLHQGIFSDISTAQSMTGQWCFKQEKIKMIGFGEQRTVALAVLPQQRVKVVASSNINSIVAGPDLILGNEEVSQFSVNLTLHFQPLQQASGTRLNASFNSMDDAFSNRWFMQFTPSIYQ